MRKLGYLLLILLTAAVTWAVTQLLMNIRERKAEARLKDWKFVALSESVTEPAVWGQNYPRQYDAYLKTVDTERTRYGGSEAYSKIDMHPVWKRIFAGYAFSVDYREERGHAYSLADQKETLRTQQFDQPGSCIQCHAGGIKHIYEQIGDGDLQAGFAAACRMPLEEVWEYVSHPVACVDCHDPETMELRVTRPAFLNGIKLLKAQEGIEDYDPNTMASRQEMRTFVCAQCHVEYYFRPGDKLLTYPWHNGLKAEAIEAYYDEIGFKDWTHAETGAPVLKAQHPEFELWSQGIHSRSGVACADCHMPYMREGAVKISDHHIRSPLLNVRRACLQCHHFDEREMKARAESIQDKTMQLMTRSEHAMADMMDAIVAAREAGVPQSELERLWALHRKAQWRIDFISAENSMGFHAPQESARVLAESIDYARQAQALAQWLTAVAEGQGNTAAVTDSEVAIR